MQTNEKTSRKKREIDTSNPIHRLKLTKEETVEIRAKTSKLKLLKLRVNSDDFDKLKQICANTLISRDFTFSALLTCSKKKVLELDLYETLSLSFTKFTHFDDKKLEKNASKINLRLISYTSVKSSLKNGLINRSIVCLSVI
jgi:hypothetical protein